MKLEWYKTDLGKMPLENAAEACKALGDYWRPPTIRELISVVNYDKIDPASDYNVKSDYYWSATISVNSTYYAWGVSMFNGFVGSYYGANNYYVWPVRDRKGE